MDANDDSFWGGCRDRGSWRLDLNDEIVVDAAADDDLIVLNADEDNGWRGCPDRGGRLLSDRGCCVCRGAVAVGRR